MRRKGITMLEILIVIMVIALMLTMMLLSFKSSEITARANNVITNMINISIAFTVAYAQNPESFDVKKGTEHDLDYIAEYLDNLKAEEKSNYRLIYYDGSQGKPDFKGWWVRYNLESDSGIRAELDERINMESTLGILSYNSRIQYADTKNITSGNKYLIRKAR